MKLPIPFFSFKRQWTELKPTLEPLISKLLESQQFVGGAIVEEFEKNLAAYLAVPHVISCNSGTDALWLALKALALAPQSIVLTTPFSFIASSSEIVAHGAHPVFIDIDEKTYNIAPHLLEEWLKTNAVKKDSKSVHKTTGQPIVGIITVDLFGQCADYEAIEKIAQNWNLWIVEDAAQSIGSHINNKKSGNFGTITTFSFYPTKNLGAFGDGGALTTHNPDLAGRIRALRNHGRHARYDYLEYGINSRLDAIQALILNEKLTYVDRWNEQRNALGTLYKNLLGKNPLLRLPVTTIGYHTYHQFCVRALDKDGRSLRPQLIAHLTQNEIGTNIFYPKPLCDIPFLQTDPRLKTACPIATAVADSIFALPIWPELENSEVAHIAACITSFTAQFSTPAATRPTSMIHEAL